ncbi:MAG: copper chaperone [Planctomycetota bacterium]|nr:MAG: copper chaperone [Planctomycetota bacterium]
MREALESLPWARKAEIDFETKQATVTVESKLYEAEALIKALKEAGYGGKVVDTGGNEKPAAAAPSRVTFHVTGMKKTKSGAT